jgi:wyosine [tRNA(Phe)-imidazoG37] synthetase (radical SAM superfamily)
LVFESIEHRVAGPDGQAPASSPRIFGAPLNEVTLPEMDARRARGAVYGPVESRRLGRSLGLNLLPRGVKRCPFNCVYCEVGAGTPFLASSEADDYPLPEVILAAVETALRSTSGLDAITFSGSGEPTLHPHFGDLVAGVARLRDRHCPTVKVVVLSNAALADRSEVHAGLALADIRLMKLDAGDPATYRAINRPDETVTFEKIVHNLSRLGQITLQTMILDGVVSNVSPAARAAYGRLIRTLQPTSIQLYRIARGTPITGLHALSPEAGDLFAAEIEAATGIPVHSF